jgi:tetratricopeptide (TPR) repeat protein
LRLIDTMLHFQHIEYLLTLGAMPVLLLLFLLAIRRKRKIIKKIGDERLVKEMTKNHSATKFALKFVLIITAFAAGVLALANLRTPVGSQKVNRNGIDVMIALDVSKSMLAQDIKPTRLDRAKQVLGKLIEKLNNDRIGIVVFAGKAYLQMPLTSDHGAAKMYLSSATTEVVPTQGTVIGEALKMCYASFNTKEKKYKAVVLISDGEDHDEEATKIAAQMASEGVIINTVGIGSPDGSTIYDPVTKETKKDNEGNVVFTKLNEAALMGIAEKGNGIYQLYNSTDEVVAKIDAQLSTMDQRNVTEDSLVNYESFFQYFLLLSLLFLVIEFFISERRKISQHKNNASKLAFVLPITFCLLPFLAHAQNENSIIKKGNEAYKKNEFEKAAEEYQKVATKTPANSTAQYNLGNALYKADKKDAAVGAFESATVNAASTDEKSKAYYNKGVVLQHDKKLRECITAYKNALKLNPQDDDARQNLQKALLQQKQQQQKPKDDPKKKEQQKEQQQPKPQPSKINKKDAEEKLKALLQQEKNLQDKLRRVNTASPNKPEKDW